MKCLLVTILLGTLVALGCGSPNQSVGAQPKTTSLAGNWTIKATSSAGGRTFIVKLVPSSCTVVQNLNTFAVVGPSCFVADNYSDQSIPFLTVRQ